MNSDNIVNSYANSNSILYGAHYITLASDMITYENNTGKFIMEYATPNTEKEAFEKVLPKSGTNNIINKDNLGIISVTKSNYIELEVPKHLFYIKNINIDEENSTVDIIRKEYYKGQKFIVVNAGGNVDSPCIVGVV